MRSGVINTVFLTLTITLFGCSSAFRLIEKPTDYSIIVAKGKTYGTVFLENASCLYCEQFDTKFSPTVEDISLAEDILKSKIKTINADRLNQGQGCPVIHKNLNKYRRQYVGHIDTNGDKIIHVNFDWNRYSTLDNIRGIYKSESDSWKKEWKVVFDGCSYYWGVKINLDNEKLFDLSVNGFG